jgi:tRNA-2-methylthio-N6-dimethylallyladenosine synthase
VHDLVAQGVTEVTLLGQNVNSYGRDLQLAQRRDGDTEAKLRPLFADLITSVASVPGIRRVRFTSPHPKDMRPETFAAMAGSPAVCEHLHYPLQSGSDRVLSLMHRGYTAERYLERLVSARTAVADLAVSTDIIVGFPGETDADFDATCSLVRRLPFKNNFIFKYSPRPGTVAIDRFPDDVPDEVKRWRNNELLAIQSETSARVHAAWVGRTVEVLFDAVRERPVHGSARDAGGGRVSLRVRGEDPGAPGAPSGWQAVGRTPGDLIVAVDVPDRGSAEALLGSLRRVRVGAARPLLLSGALEPPSGALSP